MLRRPTMPGGRSRTGSRGLATISSSYTSSSVVVPPTRTDPDCMQAQAQSDCRWGQRWASWQDSEEPSVQGSLRTYRAAHDLDV